MMAIAIVQAMLTAMLVTTVVLNGEKVIDNQPVPGCTGGALRSDVTAPGPIYLQGDHTSVQYRNIVLRPVIQP